MPSAGIGNPWPAGTSRRRDVWVDGQEMRQLILTSQVNRSSCAQLAHSLAAVALVIGLPNMQREEIASTPYSLVRAVAVSANGECP